MKIIIISGHPGSGRQDFVDLVTKHATVEVITYNQPLDFHQACMFKGGRGRSICIVYCNDPLTVANIQTYYGPACYSVYIDKFQPGGPKSSFFLLQHITHIVDNNTGLENLEMAAMIFADTWSKA